MFKTALAGEDHGRVNFVTGFNALEITVRTARLNHGGNALAQADIHAIPEREKGVGNHTAPDDPAFTPADLAVNFGLDSRIF